MTLSCIMSSMKLKSHCFNVSFNGQLKTIQGRPVDIAFSFMIDTSKWHNSLNFASINFRVLLKHGERIPSWGPILTWGHVLLCVTYVNMIKKKHIETSQKKMDDVIDGMTVITYIMLRKKLTHMKWAKHKSRVVRHIVGVPISKQYHVTQDNSHTKI